MKKFFILVFGVFVGIFLTANVFGFLIGEFTYRELKYPHIYQSLFSLEDNSKKLEKIARAERRYGWEKVRIPSPYGYELCGTWIPAPLPANQTVIFLHGLFQNRSSGLDYYTIYRERGYNVLLVDSRSHGESGGGSISWGCFEKDDVDAWVKWLKRRQPNGVIGIHGVSMGASTAALHAALNVQQDVAFYIIDSAYDDFKNLLSHQLRLVANLPPENRLPELLLLYVQAASYYEDRITFDDISPRSALAKSETPALFLHGESDMLIPPQMSRTLYDSAKAEKKELHFFPRMPHATAVYNDRQAYIDVIYKFLDKL